MAFRSLAKGLVATVALLGMSAGTVAQEVTPEQLIDGLNSVFGNKQVRASHAKGVCVTGTFTPTPDAAALSKAPQFAKPVPVLGRFSVGGGNPKAPDKVKGARGLAVRFDVGGGNNTDLVMVNAPIHFANTLEQMMGFFQARVPAADGKPDPAKVKAFGEANPDTTKQDTFIKARPLPASYAGVNYWGVHAFGLENAKGETVMVKFKTIPQAGELGLSEEEAKAKPDDFLIAELKERLGKGPVSFDFTAIVGEEGDPLDKPAAEWPEASRKSVKLGTLAIAAEEPNATCDAIIFDPSNLPDGVKAPNDPIFAARSPAYAVSQSRRTP